MAAKQSGDGADRSRSPSTTRGRCPALLSDAADAPRVLRVRAWCGRGHAHAFHRGRRQRLAERGIATLRFQFPYMEHGCSAPDPPAVAHAAVRAAVDEAARPLPGLPLFAGGKSFGGRMTSQAQAAGPLPGVRGLVFLGFPLHPAGKPADERAAHLVDVRVPMLFLQGTRDELADLRSCAARRAWAARDAARRRSRPLLPRAGALRAQPMPRFGRRLRMRWPSG